jgi:hypothetical protein
MFPSGRWRGFWEQQGWGRQWMEELHLTFAEGTVTGSGKDCIGGFAFNGSYTAKGEIFLEKQYFGRHSVQYQGRVGGEGAVMGFWSIWGRMSGPFVLMAIVEDVEELPIATIEAASVE